MWTEMWLKDDAERVMIKCCMVVSGSVQELVVLTVKFIFLDSNLEVDGSDLMTFTSGITLQGAAQKWRQSSDPEAWKA